jgi:hypothetical protein
VTFVPLPLLTQGSVVIDEKMLYVPPLQIPHKAYVPESLRHQREGQSQQVLPEHPICSLFPVTKRRVSLIVLLIYLLPYSFDRVIGDFAENATLSYVLSLFRM